MTHSARSGSITIHATRTWLAIFAFIVTAPWLAFIALRSQEASHERQAESALGAHSSLFELPSTRGPWGALRIVRIVTEPPEESLAGYLTYKQPLWQFKGYTKSSYEELLLSAGLEAKQRETLASLAQVRADSVVVAPPDDLVWSLSPESRAVLYGALSLFPENIFQQEPFRFRADLRNEWFARSGVSEEIQARIAKLFYLRGKTLLFSDPHLVVPQLGSDLERVRVLKTLSRQSTLMVHLHVDPGTDISTLVSYWAPREGRAKDIKPLLESAMRIPGGLDIDIVHLLPRFARKRIYTYPRADGDTGETVFDCHWNSMNFWNDPPDDKFSNGAFVIQTLETEYEPVLDNYRFGDIILFMKSETQAIHSAVYIADNILFTKNGPSQHSPWILMLMDTLVSHYQTNVDLKIRAYRKKRLPAARPQPAP